MEYCLPKKCIKNNAVRYKSVIEIRHTIIPTEILLCQTSYCTDRINVRHVNRQQNMIQFNIYILWACVLFVLYNEKWTKRSVKTIYKISRSSLIIHKYRNLLIFQKLLDDKLQNYQLTRINFRSYFIAQVIIIRRLFFIIDFKKIAPTNTKKILKAMLPEK